MRFIVLSLALALLAACGGGGGGCNDSDCGGLDLGPPPSGAVYAQAVPVGALPPGFLGEYDQVGDDGHVRVREDVFQNSMLATRVLTHELGHALGLDHLPNTGCVLDTDAIQTPNATLCPIEVSFAENYAGPTLVVYAGLDPPDLWQLTANAASIWNQAAGRTILAVQ